MLLPRNSLCHDADFISTLSEYWLTTLQKCSLENPQRSTKDGGGFTSRPDLDLRPCVLPEMLIAAAAHLVCGPACVCVCVCVRATLDIFLDREWKTDALLKLYNTNNNNNRFSARQKSQRRSLVATLQTVTGVSYSGVTARWTYRNSWCRYFQHPSLFRQSRNTPYPTCSGTRVTFPFTFHFSIFFLNSSKHLLCFLSSSFFCFKDTYSGKAPQFNFMTSCSCFYRDLHSEVGKVRTFFTQVQVQIFKKNLKISLWRTFLCKANWSSRHINIIQRLLDSKNQQDFVPAVPERTTKIADSWVSFPGCQIDTCWVGKASRAARKWEDNKLSAETRH